MADAPEPIQTTTPATTPGTAVVSDSPAISERAIWLGALLILVSDQLTKLWIVRQFPTPNSHDEIVVINGFFNLVHLTNDGAAFSMLKGQNLLLAVISLLALLGLIYYRRSIDNSLATGKLALGLLIGGILGNFVDRIARGSVVDFIHVYINRREGGPLSWPSFNIADSAICIGVALLFFIAWTAPDPDAEKEIKEPPAGA